MKAELCDGCRFKVGRDCRLDPPVRTVTKEWVDSGHPQIPDSLVDVTRWEFPPAFHRCGQFKEDQ